jgi:endonuclease YncB( thermonuclease family)
MKQKKSKGLPTALLPLLFTSLLLNSYLLTKQPTSTGVTVIGVIDGDTVVLEGKSKVRLRYVDAPETGNCGYTEATKTLEKLALNKKVRIEETIPDQFGRGMALVYDGEKLINLEMVKSGWVRYHHDTTKVTDAIKSVSDEAKEKKLGIYGTCMSTVNTKNPTCTIKGNIDKSTNTKIYYTNDCAQYEFTIVEEDIGEQWFCTEKDAKEAGYVKARTCKE